MLIRGSRSESWPWEDFGLIKQRIERPNDKPTRAAAKRKHPSTGGQAAGTTTPCKRGGNRASDESEDLHEMHAALKAKTASSGPFQGASARCLAMLDGMALAVDHIIMPPTSKWLQVWMFCCRLSSLSCDDTCVVCCS